MSVAALAAPSHECGVASQPADQIQHGTIVKNLEDVLHFGRPLAEAGARFSAGELRLFTDVLRQVQTRYTRRLRAVKLVGSRARRTAMDRSDYDFLVFLDRCDYEVEVPKLEELAYQLTLKHGLGAVSLSPMTCEQFDGLGAKYPGITDEFRRDAVNIWP